MRQPKTLIFHPALAPYRVDLFNRLGDALDVRVLFLSDHVPYYREFNQQELRNSLKCTHDYLVTGFRVLGREVRTHIGRIIRTFRPEVVISNEFSSTTLSVILHRCWPLNDSIGHVVWTAENCQTLRNRRYVRQALRKMCCQAADGLIVYSQEVKDCFARRWIPTEKIFVCANHQEEKSFRKKLEAARSLIDDCIRNYDLAGKKIVLYVGRLAEVKNLSRFIEAFSRMREDCPEAVLVFVGDGAERKKLQRQAERLEISERIIFAGHQEGSQLYVWYLVCAFLTLPSTEEPYGAVVNEALLAGAQVLCSSFAGSRVLIREGENGYIFDPYDIDGLANLMKRTIVDGISAEAAGQLNRKSLMPVVFERDVNSVINAVQYAAASASSRSA